LKAWKFRMFYDPVIIRKLLNGGPIWRLNEPNKDDQIYTKNLIRKT